MKAKAILVCSKCNSRNYHVAHAKTATKRIEVKKYCPHCQQATIHKESC
ncbi:MAG: 50S ribosomal protein L33 [Mycoplasmataceae bacterium]|nr:50S ribosomal protein L33 [Mycoplasmataceae bacterium]